MGNWFHFLLPHFGHFFGATTFRIHRLPHCLQRTMPTRTPSVVTWILGFLDTLLLDGSECLSDFPPPPTPRPERAGV